MKTRRKRPGQALPEEPPERSWNQRWSDVISEMDIDLGGSNETRLRLELRLGWRARHRAILEDVKRSLEFAESVASGQHPAMNKLRGALDWGHRGKSYEDFKDWRLRTIVVARAEIKRQAFRLAALEAMENPYRD